MEMDTAHLPKRRGTKKTEEEVSHFFLSTLTLNRSPPPRKSSVTRTHTYTEREGKDSTLGSLTSSSSRTRCPDGRRFEPRLPGEGGRGERSKDRRSLRLRRGRTEGTREGRMQAAARTDALSVRQGRGAHPSKRLLSRRHGAGKGTEFVALFSLIFTSHPSSSSSYIPPPFLERERGLLLLFRRVQSGGGGIGQNGSRLDGWGGGKERGRGRGRGAKGGRRRRGGLSSSSLDSTSQEVGGGGRKGGKGGSGGRQKEEEGRGEATADVLELGLDSSNTTEVGRNVF